MTRHPIVLAVAVAVAVCAAAGVVAAVLIDRALYGPRPRRT